ncbi:94_t:CDS:2, partial [Acaulospora colombiana]
LGRVNISEPFHLERIKAEYFTITRGTLKEFRIPPGINHLCYIILGRASLEVDQQSGNVVKDDCFSFAASEVKRTYTLNAPENGDDLRLIFVEDIEARSYNRKKECKRGIPTIVSAVTSSKWYNKGINQNKFARLALLTDMGLELETIPWSLNLKRIPPGTQSSNNHAHSEDDEFAIVLSGKARYWYHGIVPEPILQAGDCVGWKAGTGICHCLFNDAEDFDGSGEDLVFLDWGENKRDIDKFYFGHANPPYWRDDLKWLDHPELPLGPASPFPRFPRPDDR